MDHIFRLSVFCFPSLCFIVSFDWAFWGRERGGGGKERERERERERQRERENERERE